MKITFLPEAFEELAAAAEYYNRQSTGVGDRFVDAVQATVKEVTELPNAGPRIGPRCRKWRVRRFPFAVIYSWDGREIRVVAVAHLHRRPGYWRSRD